MAEDLVLVLLSSAMFFALKFQSLIHNVYIIYIIIRIQLGGP